MTALRFIHTYGPRYRFTYNPTQQRDKRGRWVSEGRTEERAGIHVPAGMAALSRHQRGGGGSGKGGTHQDHAANSTSLIQRPPSGPHGDDDPRRVAAFAEVAAAHHMTPVAYGRAIQSHLTTLVDQAYPYVRMDEGRLLRALERGQLRGAVAAGHAHIQDDDLHYRQHVEQMGKTGQPWTYGHLSEHPGFASAQEDYLAEYGKVAVRLDRSVYAHATLTHGDSIAHGLIPAEVRGASPMAIFRAFGHGDVLAVRSLDELHYYVELQIHGAVPVSAIRGVSFAPGTGPSPQLRAALMAARIPIETV